MWVLLSRNRRLADPQMYDEHARHTLPKLKRTYFQRCQAVEVGFSCGMDCPNIHP